MSLVQITIYSRNIYGQKTSLIYKQSYFKLVYTVTIKKTMSQIVGAHYSGQDARNKTVNILLYL